MDLAGLSRNVGIIVDVTRHKNGKNGNFRVRELESSDPASQCAFVQVLNYSVPLFFPSLLISIDGVLQ